MTAYVVLECPICEKQRLYPGTGAAADELVDGLGTHLFNHHPSTPPPEAEQYLEEALENTDVMEFEGDIEYPNRWANHIDH